MALPTKTQIRKQVGRGKFAASDFAAALNVTPVTARKHIDALVEAGDVECVGTEKILNADGEPQRGRPRRVFKVTKGASRKAATPAPETAKADA